jgi:uncharacterized protein YkwD
MRVLVWLGGILVVVAVTTGAAAATGLQSDSGRALAGPRPVVAAVPSLLLDLGDPKPQLRIPIPNFVPSPTAAPAPAPAAAPAPRPAAPSIVIGSTQQVLINGDRAAAGLRPLSWSPCLYAVALSNANRVAAQGFISHTNGPSADLGCRVGSYAGENVGYWTGGVNDAQLNSMFMNSPDHRANIMGPYHFVATAWVTASNGVAYIAVEFS